LAQTTLRDSLANPSPREQSEKPAHELDQAAREAIIRRSALRYRRLVAELNRSRDSDIERALRRA
jgi:hypothetical protein